MMDHRADINSPYASPTFDKDGSFHVNKPVGSMSISPCGRDVVLASRQGLHVIDLDSPWTPPRHLSHLTPWEVADVQWSPFASRDYWVVSTSNQKALVWNLAMSNPSASIEHVLHAHTRAITDINFSAHHPDLLATCSVDSFVHCWDLRFPAQPAITFCDWFAGATQVKWNRQEGHIIASSHDKMLRIWDDRKGAFPLRSIVAHDTKIYGIDWNRTDAQSLATCSLDHTIKLWNYESDSDEPQRVMRTRFPVWRARHTPFGHGLLAMPQRGDFNVHLYDRRPDDAQSLDCPVEAVKQFMGHENQVKEFLWRARGGFDNDIDHREFQLVTWGADLSLRLHRMTDKDLEMVGHKRGGPANKKFASTRQNAPYKTFQDDPAKSLDSLTNHLMTSNQQPPVSGLGYDYFHQSFGTIVPSPSTALGGWMSGGFVNARSGMGSNAAARKDLDPISWMKGVKIGKREGAGEQNMSTVASPEPKSHRGSEEFESLGEEITHIGSKFSKVEFVLVDIQKRFVRLSMNGPWAENHAMTYLNCQVRFPDTYPQSAVPSLVIEKTASLSTETLNKLQEDSQKIGLAYQSHGRSSFEAQIRYLQGEQTLDDTIAWTKDDTDVSIYGFASDSGGSSSDDEDELGAFVGKQDDEVGLTGSGVLSVSNANVNVPLAQTCGAVWTDEGRLVCFFRAKEESPPSLAGTLGLEDPTSFSKLKRHGYEKFGRFYPPSSKGRSKTSSYGTIASDDSNSDSGSDSSEVSSNSSVSARDLESRGQYLGLQPSFRVDVYPFQPKSKLTDEAQRSNASLSVTRSGSTQPKSTIAIYNLNTLLPSRSALARKYLFAGSDAYVHNSDVARDEGLPALAELWLIIDMILKDKVPLEAVPVLGTVSRLSALPVSLPLAEGDTTAEPLDGLYDSMRLKAAVKWGNHPFGHKFLVQELFSYFSSVADIQMLALMSCIFATPKQLSAPEFGEEGHPPISKSSSRHPLSTVLTSPSITSPHRVDYFPSVEVAFSVLQPNASIASAVPIPSRARTESISLSSSLGASMSELPGPFGSALTPPMSFKSSRKSFEQPDASPAAISNSPERSKWSYRSSSHSAGVLSSSLQRTFWSASASSSPPNAGSRKRISPIGSYGITSGSTQLPGNLPMKLLSRSMSNAEEYPEKLADKQRMGGQQRRSESLQYRVVLKNQNQFYNDGYSDVPLLDVEDEPRYRIYREMYADMLAAWGLYLERATVLKYNSNYYLAQEVSNGHVANESGSDLLLGKHKRNTSLPNATRWGTLQLCRACSWCGRAGAAGWLSSTGHCPDCHARPTPTVCVLCEEVLHGRASPCLICGHLLHTACRAVLAESSETGGSDFGCIYGCGCSCDEDGWRAADELIQASTARPPPPTRAPSADRDASIEADGLSQSMLRDLDSHEDVAYQSLKKNLGGFGRGRGRAWKGKSRASSVTD